MVRLLNGSCRFRALPLNLTDDAISWENSSTMRYELDIPEDVDRRLTEQANEAGQDKVHYLQTVISLHVQSGMASLERPGRQPDLPLEAAEINAPFELPRPGLTQAVPVRAEGTGTRLPDPFLE